MHLKRFYKTPPGWVKQVNDRGECTNPPPLDYVALADTGVSAEQNFSERLINSAIAEGWCTISRGKLILHVAPEDLMYTIRRGPGHYCCHCGAALTHDSSGLDARAHVAAAHAGADSPDPLHPGGYRVVNGYECVLDAAQHDKYRVTAPARVPKFHERLEH